MKPWLGRDLLSDQTKLDSDCYRQTQTENLLLKYQNSEWFPFYSDSWCMSHQRHYEMSYRGHATNFIGVYIEDASCGTPAQTFPTFVKCSGPGAIIPRDGASCTCGDGSTWNSGTSECECDAGYTATPYVNWRRDPICILCSGIGASGGASNSRPVSSVG